MANKAELIRDFLVKQKPVLNLRGIERAAGVPGSYWAKILCGAGGWSWEYGNHKRDNDTIEVLKELRNDIDKLIKAAK